MNDAAGHDAAGWAPEKDPTTDGPEGPATTRYIAAEVVGVFANSSALNAAVEQLGIAGIDRAAMSVLGVDPHHTGDGQATNDSAPRSARSVSDDPTTPQSAFVSHVSRKEAQGMAIAIPMEIAGFGTAWAMAAAGGALLLAIGATVAAGAVGAGLGALLYHAVARRHAAAIHAQIAHGGLILWVTVHDKATEARVTAVLQRCDAGSVHTHMIDRQWGVADVPLHNVEPDPFLEHDPSLDAV
jgi:hypothetical protein